MVRVEAFYYDNEALSANTYLLIDEDLNTVIVDPGKDYDGIVDYIIKNHLKPKAIFLTHAHFDHIRGIPKLIETFNILCYVHILDEDKLKNPRENCSWMMGQKVIIDVNTVPFEAKMIFQDILNEPIKIIHTPFHTNGSCCLYLKKSKILCSGDTLFKLSIGRSDLPTSDEMSIMPSLARLKDLPDDVKVYPGHGRSTIIGYEKEYNPYFK